MIRTLVVDDEKLARDRLIGFLRKFDDIDVIGQAKNGVEAVAAIEAEEPDLVFLDVQMPGMDGFAVLKATKVRPSIIFATAYDEYAIQAFDVHAADYILKPINRQRLEQAVDRVRERRSGGVAPLAVDELVDKLEERSRRFLPHVPVHRGKQILVLPVDEVLYFEVEYRLVYAHIDGDRFMTNFTLKELEERLDPATFFRAHKSRLVNLNRVGAIVPWFGGRYKLVMRDKASTEVELSRAQARQLRARMQW